MKLYLLYLFVVIACAARPYRYAREDYLPARRYLRGAASVYSRPLSRPIKSLEEESYPVPEPRSPLVQQQPEVTLEKHFNQALTGKSLPKEEEVKPYVVVENAPTEGLYENQVKETEPPVEEESQDTGGYQDKSYFDEVEDDGYEEEHEYHHEDEPEEEEEEYDDYPFDEEVGDSNFEFDEYEDHEDVNKEESDDEASAEEEKQEEKEQHTMPLELADIIFSFPNCNTITCSKAGLEGYGCSDSKCKFICSKSECYEYPDGPTDLEGLEDLEDVSKEATTTTTEETTTTTEATTTTTTTTTTPEPETTTQAPRKRRPSFDKRGKGRRARSRQ
ncbi:hypothetical protein Aperf_G00000073340 [Anoplocephala perfoliata]